MAPKPNSERYCSVLALAGSPAHEASLKVAVVRAPAPEGCAKAGGSASGSSAPRWTLPRRQLPGKPASRQKMAVLALAQQAFGLDLRSRLCMTPVLKVGRVHPPAWPATAVERWAGAGRRRARLIAAKWPPPVAPTALAGG